MRKATLRNWLKASVPLNAILFALLLVDHFQWDNAAAIPLTIIYAILLVAILLLVVAPSGAPFERIDTVDEEPRAIIYPRDHG